MILLRRKNETVQQLKDDEQTENPKNIQMAFPDRKGRKYQE
jgi:hypothetical protein